MQRKILGRVLMLSLLATLGLFMPGCVYHVGWWPGNAYVSGTVAVEPFDVYVDPYHHGVVHDYYYYPGVDVYYGGGEYYWSEGGHWIHGRRLPPRYHVREGDRVRFRSDARYPYEVHTRVREHVDRRPGPETRRDHPDARPRGSDRGPGVPTMTPPTPPGPGSPRQR